MDDAVTTLSGIAF